MKTKIGQYEIFIKVIYKNNRNIYFRFDENLFLIVTCPKRTFDDDIIKIIEKNEDSLIKMYEKAKKMREYQDEFWYLGKKYNVVYKEDASEVTFSDDEVIAKDDEMLENYLADKRTEIFLKEVELCKKCFVDLPDFRTRFRKMKTRWGVCNRAKKIITLNTELIKKDIKLLDYVIIHELAHFYEGNHSKKFWEIVSLACPDYKERRKALRK